MTTELTLVEVLQKIVRDELRRLRFPEPAVVIGPSPSVTAGGDNHYHCDVKLRSTGLELVNVPIATGRKGLVALPGVGDLVLVAFMGGDINAPVITGRLFAAADEVPEAKPGEFVYVQPDAEEQSIRRVFLQFPNGTKLTMDDQQIELETPKAHVTIKDDGDVAVDTEGNVTLKSRADVTVEAGGSLTLKADRDITLESAGGRLSLAAATGASLKGGTATEIQGASVAIKGMTDFSPA